MNVGSGGGAAAAPAAGGAAAAGGEAAAEEKKEEKAEGTDFALPVIMWAVILTSWYREGGVRRGHGFRSLRLSNFHFSLICSFAWPRSLGAGGVKLAGVDCYYKQTKPYDSIPSNCPVRSIYERGVDVILGKFYTIGME